MRESRLVPGYYSTAPSSIRTAGLFSFMGLWFAAEWLMATVSDFGSYLLKVAGYRVPSNERRFADTWSS